MHPHHVEYFPHGWQYVLAAIIVVSATISYLWLRIIDAQDNKTNCFQAPRKELKGFWSKE